MIYFYILAIFSHKYKIKLAMTKTHSCTNNLPDNSEQQKRLLVSRLYDHFLIHLPLHEFERVNRIISHRKENFLFPFQSVHLWLFCMYIQLWHFYLDVNSACTPLPAALIRKEQFKDWRSIRQSEFTIVFFDSISQKQNLC